MYTTLLEGYKLPGVHHGSGTSHLGPRPRPQLSFLHVLSSFVKLASDTQKVMLSLLRSPKIGASGGSNEAQSEPADRRKIPDWWKETCIPHNIRQ
jgi:hypothetical protein